MSNKEQNTALTQLRDLAAPHRFRVRPNAEGFPEIPGRYGRIEWVGPEELAVYCDRPRLFQKLWAIPGVTKHQTADREMRALFPPEALAQVASVIRASRRPGVNSGAAKRVGAKTAFRGTSGAQKPRSTAGAALHPSDALKSVEEAPS